MAERADAPSRNPWTLKLADEGARIIADEIVEYSDLLQAIKNRVVDLKIHGTRFDALAGWPEGYLSKLTCAAAPRRIGMQSMGVLLSAMGVKLQMVEDPRGTERLRRLQPRNPSYVRAMPAAAGILFTARMLKRIRRMGGRARMAQLTPKQRSELGRHAAQARWQKGNKR
jgi:hypothetical protein